MTNEKDNHSHSIQATLTTTLFSAFLIICLSDLWHFIQICYSPPELHVFTGRKAVKHQSV